MRIDHRHMLVICDPSYHAGEARKITCERCLDDNVSGVVADGHHVLVMCHDCGNACMLPTPNIAPAHQEFYR